MTVAEQLGRLMGDSLARGAERENKRRCRLLMIYLALITLEMEFLLQK